MKKTVSALIIATGLVIPTFIQAQEITFTTELTNYDGENAYLVKARMSEDSYKCY